MANKNKVVCQFLDRSTSWDGSTGYTLLDFQFYVVDKTTGTTGDPTLFTGTNPSVDPGDAAYFSVEYNQRDYSPDQVYDLIRDTAIATYGRSVTDGSPSILSDGTTQNATTNTFRVMFDATDVLISGWGRKGDKGDKGAKGDPDSLVHLYAGDPIRPNRIPKFSGTATTLGPRGDEPDTTNRFVIMRTHQGLNLSTNLAWNTMVAVMNFAPGTAPDGKNVTDFDEWQYRLAAWPEGTRDIQNVAAGWSVPITTISDSGFILTSANIDLTNANQDYICGRGAFTANVRVIFAVEFRRLVGAGAGKNRGSKTGRIRRVALQFS